MKQLYFIWLWAMPALIFAQTPQTLFQQGQEAQSQKNYQQALQYFEQAAKLDKKNAEVHAQIGWTLVKLQKYKKAISPLKTAQKLSPKEAKYLYYQAVALDSMGRERDVMDITGKALKLKSEVADVYILRANIYLRKKDYNTAIANLNRAIELDTKNALAYLKRAYAKYRVVDSSGACSDWRKAYSLGAGEAQKYINENCKE